MTGIDGIVDDFLDGNMNYYTLNGTRADAPTPGNYYVHQGKKLFKK